MSNEATRRRFLTGAGAGVAAAVAGCSGDQPATTGTEAGESESTEASDSPDSDSSTEASGTLRTALTGKIESLDPIIKGTGGVNQWAEGLMDYENGTLPPVPGLATDVEIIDGGAKYRFTLREGVQFHDGSTLTASDVVYCWERAAQSENSQNADDIIGSTFTIAHEGDTASNLKNYVPGSLGVSAVDETTLEVTMQSPYFGSLFQIASESTFVIYPENTVGDIEREDVKTDGKYAYQEAFGTQNGGPKVAGTGPFQVETWSKGDELVMSRFDEYWDSPANVESVQSTILSGNSAQYKRALNGNLDIFQVPRNKFSADRQQGMEQVSTNRKIGKFKLENGEVVNHAQVGELGTDIILFNTERTPAGVRKAFAAMVNQHDVAANIYPDHEPAYTMTPPQMYPNVGGFESPQAAQEAHYTEGAMAQTSAGENGYLWGVDEANLDRAQEIAERTGVAGNSYEFYIGQNQPAFQTFAQRVQQKAKSINIDIEVKTVSYGSLISKGVFDGAYDMYQLGDTAEVPAPDNILRFYPPQVARRQATKWGPTDKDSVDPTVRSDWESDIQFEVAKMWAQFYQGNKQDTEAAAAERARAYLAVEEGTWASVQILPVAHRVSREYWRPEIDYEPPGVMGDKTYNNVVISR